MAAGRTRRLLAVALLVAAAGAAGAWAFAQLGRSPGDIVSYLKRRLEGHPTLEMVALPVLDRINAALDQPDPITLRLPFVVPPLPPNPLKAVPGAPEALEVIRVGPGRALTRIGAAAQLAKDGAVIEIDPGDYVADVAVWQGKDLTIRGLGDRVRVIAAGADAEGKASWVVRGGAVTIENVEFWGGKAADGNGGGIRLETGQLVVRRCRFFGNQNGLLTSSEPGITLDVEDSEFGWNGAGDGLTHGLYVGRIERLRVRGSYFHHGNVGHLLKSRAKVNRIEYNRLSDESGGRSSYELEFPDGGIAEVVGNVLQQGAETRNSVMLSFGAESLHWPRNELRLSHNTLVNDARWGGTFVRVAPGAGPVVLRNNLYVGDGRVVDARGGVDAAGDRRVDWPALERPSRQDWRLRERDSAGLALPDPALVPRAEFALPAGTRPLAGPATLPGALQNP